MKNMKESAQEMLKESADIKIKIAETMSDKIVEAAILIIDSIRKGGKLVFCGIGGSAADSQHLSTELVHQFEIKRRKIIPSMALTVNTSTLTAIGNDWGFDEVFSRQVEGLVTEKDVLVGISTSGNSSNVIKAIEQAKENGAKTIGFLGKDGGKLNEMCDISFIIPSENTARIQESHIAIGHILCKFIEEELLE